MQIHKYLIFVPALNVVFIYTLQRYFCNLIFTLILFSPQQCSFTSTQRNLQTMDQDYNSPNGWGHTDEEIRIAEHATNSMSREEMLRLIKKYQSQEREAFQNRPKGKIQGPKYEPEYEKQIPNGKLSRSILVQQKNIFRPRQEQEKSVPPTDDKLMSNLDETGTGQYQPSESMFTYSQPDQSDYLTYGIPSRNASTLDHTGNTSNFSYKTKPARNQSQQLSDLLERNELDISDISVKSQSPITKQQIKQLEEQFHQTFQLLKCQKAPLRALTSREQLRSQPHLYIEDKKTFLFKMVLPPLNGLSLNDFFFNDFIKTDHFLLNSVDIGVQIELEILLKIFEKYYQSLRKLAISREFDEDEEEHGFDFIKNIKNQEGLVEIEWRSAKLTKTLASSFKACKLPNLLQLTIDLGQKVENEKECGNLINQIFNNIDGINQKSFKIVLCSSVEKKQNLGKKIGIYKNRIQLRPKGKSSNVIQKPEKQQKPSQDKQPEPSFNKKKNSQTGAQSQPQQQSNNSQQQPHQSFSNFRFNTSKGGQIKNFSIGGNQYSN